ncbi:unnamed protein product [Amoebophrya sp. A25]|nr:unnamed protein product [Amoebophrya sp. A25]|eukprot:GSA25T00010247001.1
MVELRMNNMQVLASWHDVPDLRAALDTDVDSSSKRDAESRSTTVGVDQKYISRRIVRACSVFHKQKRQVPPEVLKYMLSVLIEADMLTMARRIAKADLEFARSCGKGEGRGGPDCRGREGGGGMDCHRTTGEEGDRSKGAQVLDERSISLQKGGRRGTEEVQVEEDTTELSRLHLGLFHEAGKSSSLFYKIPDFCSNSSTKSFDSWRKREEQRELCADVLLYQLLEDHNSDHVESREASSDTQSYDSLIAESPPEVRDIVLQYLSDSKLV